MHFLHKYAPRGKDKKAKTWLLARHLCFGLQSSEKKSNYHRKSTIIIRRRRQKVEKRLNLPTILFLGPRIIFFAHESHESTRIFSFCVLKATCTVARITLIQSLYSRCCYVRHYTHCAKFVRFVRPNRSPLKSIARDSCRFLDIFGCARQNSNKFGSALACTKIRVIRGQKIYWAKKTIRGQKSEGRAVRRVPRAIHIIYYVVRTGLEVAAVHSSASASQSKPPKSGCFLLVSHSVSSSTV